MAVRDILLLGNPVLRVECQKVKDFSDPTFKQTIVDLRDTLADFRKRRGFGRGIAAPQIGVTRRIIFVNIDAPIVLVNPEIIKRSKEKMLLWDDCFSFPDLIVKVRRHTHVSVSYQDEKGIKRLLKVNGGLSELLQHEIDHIDGILAIDRAIDERHIVMRSEWEKMKQSEGKPIIG